MIELFACNLKNTNDQEINYFTKFVSEQRKNHIAGYKRIGDVKRSLFGELLVRKIVIDHHDLSNDKITFDFNQYGKPSIFNLPGFHFSLSHSGDWVVCAAGEKAVGADIEEIRQVDFNIAESFFSTEENHDLLSLPEDKRPKHFFRLWTLKESFLKAQGTGLAGDLKAVKFRLQNKGIIALQKDQVYYKTYHIDHGYCLAVCGYEKEFAPKIKMVNIKHSDFQ